MLPRMRGQAFGMTFESEFDLPGAWPAASSLSAADASDLQIIR